MKEKTLFQTLEDRENPDVVEAEGPFSCHWKNTWLGEGYYFWDSFIENAHWWGEVRYHNKYIITKFKCDFDTEKCFDLVGDTDHMLDFSESIEFLKNKNQVTSETTVSRIINHLRNKVGFNYEAIRVYGIKSISEHKEKYERYRHRLNFELSKPQYLDYKPAIQICIFEKDGMNLRDIHIEYPDKYNSDFVI